MKTLSEWVNFGGRLSVHEHQSDCCNCAMQFAVFTPPAAAAGPVPVLWYLSGLTCTWANVMEKSGIQRRAAERGLMVIAPDTSPRGDEVPDEDAYDLGQGAGFYLNATQTPWATHYRMYDYLTRELPALVATAFPANMERQGISGHSMGGHGALTVFLKNQQTFRSVSAFSPVSSPSEVPWGRKAFSEYLGDDKSAWSEYDASRLIEHAASSEILLIDTGDADQFLDEQLKPRTFIERCQAAGQPLDYRLRKGYDHSYYFIASFIAEHIDHHASRLLDA